MHHIYPGDEYVNRVMFMVYDQRTAERFGGRYPIPLPGAVADHVVTGTGVIGLTEALADRLEHRTRATMPAGIAPVSLGPRVRRPRWPRRSAGSTPWPRRGRDDDFGRGTKAVEFAFHGPPAPDNRLPNSLMHPLDLAGALHAIAVVGTTFDTNSGPRIGDRGADPREHRADRGPLRRRQLRGRRLRRGIPRRRGDHRSRAWSSVSWPGPTPAAVPSGSGPAVKLAYRDVPAPPDGRRSVVVLHREGVPPWTGSTRWPGPVARRRPGGRAVRGLRLHPSGMEIGGHLLVPGAAGIRRRTDPISLAKAVVQVGDLLDDLDLDRPVLTGSGQGGVVALGAGLLARRTGTSVVCVDAPAAHADLLPAALLAPDPDARILLLAGGPDAGSGLGRIRDLLDAHGIHADSWCWSGEGSRDEGDRAMADHTVEWLQEG